MRSGSQSFAAAIAGVVPALKVTSGGVDVRLRAMSSGGGGLQFGGMWTAIIVAQIALTTTLPLVTSVLRNDYVKQRDTPAGFAADEFLTAILALDRADGAAAAADTMPLARAARLEARYRMLADRLESEPGVLGVTYANALPLTYNPIDRIEMDSGPVAPRGPNAPTNRRISMASVDPRFFDVIGAPVLRGRSLTSADAEQDTRAMVVNEYFVAHVMGGHNPIGRRFRFAAEDDYQVARVGPRPWYQIVGVVRDLGIEQEHQGSTAARIYAATLPKNAAPLRIAIHVRGDPQRFATRLRELAQAIDPALLVESPLALPRLTDADVAFAAFGYYLLAGFAGVALVLSLTGVYAVTAFAVAKRTREIGVRVALGATASQIVAATFKRPFIQIALGIGVGALVLSILVVGQVEQLSVRQLAPVGIVVALIGGCCMVACIVPVRRALRIQPTEALKDDG